MTRKKFLEWGQTWHYPQLVLGPGQVLRHGKAQYEHASREMIQLASRRIERWNAMIMPKRIDSVIQHVDKLISRSAETTDSLIVERV